MAPLAPPRRSTNRRFGNGKSLGKEPVGDGHGARSGLYGDLIVCSMMAGSRVAAACRGTATVGGSFRSFLAR